jgi:multidrug efflux pump subunit AcrA (membrane-fusion protein)
VEVRRGDLEILVSPNGNLTMPEVYDLKFGGPGKVMRISEYKGAELKEGAVVKAGSLLAFLDDTTQRNAIRTALYNIQSAIYAVSSGKSGQFYFNIWDFTDPNRPILVLTPYLSECGQYDLPNNFPELSALRIYEEAQSDLTEAMGFFEKGQYKDAGYKLGMTYFDIEVCEELIKNRPDAATLAGNKVNSVAYPDGTAGTYAGLSDNDALVVNYLLKFRDRLLGISQLMMYGLYDQVKTELDKARQELAASYTLVESTVHTRGKSDFTYPDTPTSLNFLQASLRSLDQLDDYVAGGNAQPDEVAKKVYLARLNAAVGYEVLQNQTLIYNWNSGSNWKVLQQYNLAVQGASIALDKAKRDIMNTVIIAPVDGSVVSISLKKGYITSAQDYSTRPAIKLVDTRTVKFTGMVDEIDVMKVKIGQTARLSVDAIPNKVLTGKVKFISPFGTTIGQVIKYAVTVVLDPTDVELRGTLSATADIQITTVRNAILVPISAVVTSVTGTTVSVWNETKKELETREVTVGSQTFQYAEIKSGLAEGEKVATIGQKPTVNPTVQPRSGGPMIPIR